MTYPHASQHKEGRDWCPCPSFTCCVQAGADPAYPSATGDTPLHAAVWSGDGSVITALLAAGAPLEHVNSNGETALVLAVNQGAVESINTLTDAGASAHCKIHYAALHGHAQVGAWRVHGHAWGRANSLQGRTNCPVVMAQTCTHGQLMAQVVHTDCLNFGHTQTVPNFIVQADLACTSAIMHRTGHSAPCATQQKTYIFTQNSNTKAHTGAGGDDGTQSD